MTSPARGLSRAGKHSSSPSANSGTRHSGGAGPATPLSSITVWMVDPDQAPGAGEQQEGERELDQQRETILVVKSLEP